MEFKRVLKQLSRQLDLLSIYYQPHKKVTKPNEIFLGNRMVSYYTDRRINLYQGGQYHSTTEMLYKMDHPIYSTNIPIENYQFFFEDLSPDACLSFILVYCQYHGLTVDHFPSEWIDYTIRWELGDVKTTGKPHESWGCLHSSLAHAFFIMEEKIDANGNLTPIIDEAHVIQGLIACIRLAIALLLEGIVPYEIPYIDHVEEYNRANMYLKMEYQKYMLGLKHATITQLELPVIHTNRKLLVDAFITTENTYIGLLKSFLIHDETSTWLGSGFQFFAIHRPDFKGTGHDMVIQVDPQLRVHLKDLWEKLEKLEEERQVIPMKRPNQCYWYHNEDQYTILAAPKHSHTLSVGSQIEWADVVRLIWELYNPGNSITVNPYLEDGSIGQSCRIYECEPILKGEKFLTAAKWNSLGQQQVLVSSPTLQRYLAVCASNADQTTIPPIHPLPLEDSFDFMELPFGYALINQKGIFILDDWNNEPFDYSLYKNEVRHLMERVETFQQIHQECIEMMTKVKAWLNQYETLSGDKLSEVNHWITKQKTEIRHTLLRTMLSSSDYYLQTFRKAIEKRWAIQSQLNELYNTVTELEHIIENHMNIRTNRLINLITIFGFPFVLFSGLFELIFQNIPSPMWFGIHWTNFLLFFILSFLGTWALSRYIKNSSQQRSKDEDPKI